MRAITFINRFLMVGVTMICMSYLILGDDAIFLVMLSGIPLGVFQVIASLILIYFREQITGVFKFYLGIYYFLVELYFLIFYVTNFDSSQEILLIMPILLAIGLTVIIELAYKITKKSYEN